MTIILNLIWLFFGGIWLAIGYLLFGLLALIFIVTAPAALAAFRISMFVLWPFGQAVVVKPSAGTGSVVMNIVWFVLAGLWLAFFHVGTAVLQAITIIGIPLALANLKLIPITCFPFGKDVVSRREAEAFGYRSAVVDIPRL